MIPKRLYQERPFRAALLKAGVNIIQLGDSIMSRIAKIILSAALIVSVAGVSPVLARQDTREQPRHGGFGGGYGNGAGNTAAIITALAQGGADVSKYCIAYNEVFSHGAVIKFEISSRKCMNGQWQSR